MAGSTGRVRRARRVPPPHPPAVAPSACASNPPPPRMHANPPATVAASRRDAAFSPRAAAAKGLFGGYTAAVWLLVTNNALNGLAISAILKFANNIVRVFAVSRTHTHAPTRPQDAVSTHPTAAAQAAARARAPHRTHDGGGRRTTLAACAARAVGSTRWR
eukprot:147427-Prymnesium_polylepis.1